MTFDMNTLIMLKNVRFSYDNSAYKFDILVDSLEIYKKDICYLYGPSGCGKTTVLNLAAGMIKPSTGHRILNPAIENDRFLCYVMQKSTLLPWLSIENNIYQEADFRKIIVSREIVEQYLQSVDLQYADLSKTPSQLSGGMVCRADILRAVCMLPKVLLLDEAFANMDYKRRLSIYQLLANKVEQGMGILACSHDLAEVLSIADRILFFDDEGKSRLKEIKITTPRKLRSEYWFGSEEAAIIRKTIGWGIKPVS